MKKERSPFTVRSSRAPGGSKLWVLLLLVLVAAAPTYEETITAGALLEEVRILASPAMAGRGVGTPGIEKAAEHIAREFQQAGLKPGGTQGYRQTFEVITGVRVGPETRMRVISEGPDAQKSEALAETLFTPFGFSEDGAAHGEVVFAGYGITAPELHYDDYAGIDVTDKIVLVMSHEPRE
ncbi:MAG: hypothetical protein ACREKR_14015, partial [Candidatus Methylomirabilales bacterium]